MTVQTALSSSYEEVGDCRWQTRDGEAKQEQTENSFAEILGKCDLGCRSIIYHRRLCRTIKYQVVNRIQLRNRRLGETVI